MKPTPLMPLLSERPSHPAAGGVDKKLRSYSHFDPALGVGVGIGMGTDDAHSHIVIPALTNKPKLGRRPRQKSVEDVNQNAAISATNLLGKHFDDNKLDNIVHNNNNNNYNNFNAGGNINRPRPQRAGRRIAAIAPEPSAG